MATTKKKRAKPTIRKAKRETRASYRDTEGWFHDWLIGEGKSVSGEVVNTTTALRVAAVFACIRNISEDVAKLPLVLYEKKLPRGKERMTEMDLYRVLHDEPNDEMTSFDFRQTVTHDMLLKGNGYAEIQRNQGGGVVSLNYIDSDRVTVKRDDNGKIIYRVRQNSGDEVVIQASEMFHLKGIGDGTVGWSVLRLARESFGAAIATDKFGAAWFGNGSRPGGVLEHPAKLNPDSAKRLRESWESMHAGSSNSGRTAVLEEGMKYHAISIPPEDAQFIESKQHSIEDICRWFRMPPHKVQHLLRSTNNNIEHQSIEYVTDTLMSHLVRWEQEIKRKLIPRMAVNLFAEHVVLGLLRGDAASRSSFYREQWNIGALSQNDIRELENMNGIGPAGDVYYVQASYVPSEIAAKGPNPEPEPAPTPEPEPEPDEERSLPASLVESHRDLLAARLKLRLKDEADRVGKASHAADFADRIERFYADAPDHVFLVVGDVIHAAAVSFYAVLSGGKELDAGMQRVIHAATLDAVTRHVAKSVAEAADAKLVESWRSDRPAVDAAAITGKIIELVTSFAKG
jgi:HK97 family phage portal protein